MLEKNKTEGGQKEFVTAMQLSVVACVITYPLLLSCIDHVNL